MRDSARFPTRLFEANARLMRVGTVLPLLLSAVLLTPGCDEKKPPEPYTLLEVIYLEGTCAEDHAKQSADYSGRVVRWRNDHTGKLSEYGSVNQKGEFVDRILAKVENPAAYFPPEIIQFWEIDRIATEKPNWVLHGVSVQGDKDGYAATCELRVTSRAQELPTDEITTQPKR